MARSLKASEEGLRLVEEARKNKGWKKQDDVWSDLAGVAKITLKRFRGGEAIDKDKFIRLCEAVEVDYQKVIGCFRYFWGSSPDVDFFCSRQTELNTLTQWLIKDKCRLVGITAMGGMGKTYLTKNLACSLKTKFTGIYWVGLQNARRIEEVIEDLIKFLSNQQEINLPASLDDCLLKLLDYLTKQRWLIVFDNVESILESNCFSGKYRPDYQTYGELFHKLGSCSHNSSILVTSREQLPEIKRLAAPTAPVRIFDLMGMNDGAMGILRRKGIKADEFQLEQLIKLYQGNPLALEFASATIKQTFQGDLAAFLSADEIIFDDIQNLLDAQFCRLTSQEQSLMYWLAIYREPVETAQIKADTFSGLSTRQIVSTLDSLKDRCLLEVTASGYTLQNVVMEYVTELIIATAVSEIKTGELNLLHTHSLIQATAPDYVRICQYQVILQPLLEIFTKTLSPKQLENCLFRLITQLQQHDSDLRYGYAAGNIINLLVALKANLTAADFSGLTVRQAYLQGVPLPGVNFSNCHFHQCLFSHALGSVLTVTFSPDQTLLATGGTDGCIRLWRVADGQEVAVWKAHSDWIRVLTFSRDGQLIASGSNDKSIKIWHWQTQECQQVLRGHTDWIWSLKFTRKNNLDLLISTSSDHTARVWHWQTGKTVYTYENLPELAGIVWSVAFSPDGETFATGSATKVQLWNINTREWIRDVPESATRVRALCFSPDGKLLVGSNDQQEIVVWRTDTGECVETMPVPPSAAIWSLQYASDGTELISSGTDSIQLWDMEMYQPLTTLQQLYHRVRSVAYSETQKLLAVGSDDGLIRLWDTQRGQSVRTLQSHTNRIWTLAAGKIGAKNIIASGSDDGEIRLWDGENGELIYTLSGHRGRVRSLDFSQDGKLVSSSNDRTVKIWDLTTFDCVQTYREHADWVWKVIYLNHHKSLISLSDDKTVLHCNLTTGKTEPFPLSKQEWIWTAAVNPQASILALAGDNPTIDLWDINSKTKLISLKGHTERIKSAVFNHTGDLLVSASDDHTIKIWSVKTQECLQTIKNSQQETRSVIVISSASQRSQLIASAGDDCIIRVFDLDKGKLQQTFTGHSLSIWSLCYSAQLDTLYSCGEDETIKAWHLATGECLDSFYIPKLYQGMNLTQATGLTPEAKQSLIALGANLSF